MKPKCACFEHGVGDDKVELAALMAAQAVASVTELYGICPDATEYFLHRMIAVLMRGLAMQRANSELCEKELGEMMGRLMTGVAEADAIEEAIISGEHGVRH